jgi:hypothetical protein
MHGCGRRPEFKSHSPEKVGRRRMLEGRNAVLTSGCWREWAGIFWTAIANGAGTKPVIGTPLRRWINALAMEAPAPGRSIKLTLRTATIKLHCLEHQQAP